MITFGFGLVHGFGFSFALRETLQFAGSHLLTSLLSFNVGVELGQLLVLALLVPALELLFRFVVAERIGTIILSALVAHTGWHWMIERGAVLMQFPDAGVRCGERGQRHAMADARHRARGRGVARLPPDPAFGRTAGRPRHARHRREIAMGALHRETIQTPVGRMLALASSTGLAALEFDSPQRFWRLERRLKRWYSPYTIADESSTFIDDAKAWLARYFAGEPTEAVELDVRGTPFERRVWDLLLAVPSGETRTYGDLARTFGSINRARAVGLAVGSNPVSLMIPCHRIVGSTGSLTGYGGGLDRKRWLLNHEARAGSTTEAQLF